MTCGQTKSARQRPAVIGRKSGHNVISNELRDPNAHVPHIENRDSLAVQSRMDCQDVYIVGRPNDVARS